MSQPPAQTQTPQVNQELEKKLEQLSNQETEQLVKSFQDHFNDCTKACKKPNILVAGITGSGKSTLINAVFGEEMAKAGAGMPVTQHFQKFCPSDKPIIVYDSKGLEWSEHEAFIKETGKFFISLRQKPDVAEHIHVVWYVINTARGRFENFEADIVREVFHPTPVIFILNKCDLADAKQLKAIKEVVTKEDLPNNKGIHVCISKRENWTQSWCPDCFSDDVFYDEETKELECSDCGFTCIQKDDYGLKKLINHTCELLPELAKDAFMFSQTASVSEKDRRALEIIKSFAHDMTLDAKGTFIKKVAEMCAKLFVIWGWPLTADTFKEGLASMQKEYISQLRFQERLAAVAVDKLFGSRLSKAFAGVIGLTMNRGMKRLNEKLIEKCATGDMKDVKLDDFMQESDMNEDFIRFFFETAITEGIDPALDKFWDLSGEELTVLMSQMQIGGGPSADNLFFNQDVGTMVQLTEEEQLALASQLDVEIGEVNADTLEGNDGTATNTEHLPNDDDETNEEGSLLKKQE